MALALQHVPADQDVQEQIAVQDDHVPEQDGVGGGVLDDVERPVGTAHVHHDEQQAHGHRGHRQEFSQDGDPAEGFIIVQVVRQNYHHGRGRHADQVGKLGDIKAPGDVPAQAGDAPSRS